MDDTKQRVSGPQIIDQIQELSLEDRRISSKSLDEQLDISRERIRSIIHEDLDKLNYSANWVPKCLDVNSDSPLSNFRKFFGSTLSKKFPVSIETMDEIWLHLYDPESKEKLTE